jgi:integrase
VARLTPKVEVADLAGQCGEYDALVLVLAYCGLRWGEVTAIKRADLDFGRARINVKAAVERVGGKYKLGPTKTHEVRSVPVAPPVLAILLDRVGATAPDRLVFPGAGGFLKNYEFRKVFDPAAARAGLKGIAPHELRHTCASLAIRNARASIKAVQTMLGHKTATMTLDTYGNLYEGDLDDVAVRMGSGFVYQVRTEGV